MNILLTEAVIVELEKLANQEPIVSSLTVQETPKAQTIQFDGQAFAQVSISLLFIRSRPLMFRNFIALCGIRSA
jgi:hypothetical protein